jgi:hypothetical protein
MQRHNVERVVVSIANQAIARRQIEAIHRAMPHVEIQTYRYYYWNTWEGALQQDESFIGAMRWAGYDIQMHWIDIEDNGVTRNVANNVRDLHAMIHFWNGKCRTGIYTAKWVWDLMMPGITEFSFMPLWYADWDWQEKLTLDVPFGGWTTGAMRQTYGDFLLDGVLLCDTNHYEKEIIITPPPPPVPPKYNVSVVYSEGADNKTVTLVLPKDAKVEASGFGDK